MGKLWEALFPGVKPPKPGQEGVIDLGAGMRRSGLMVETPIPGTDLHYTRFRSLPEAVADEAEEALKADGSDH